VTKPKPKKPPKKRRPRRVVLGVGHPWFNLSPGAGRTHVSLSAKPNTLSDVVLNFRDLGNYNRVRLVAEVLK
jgi:hypothetical protein